MIAACLFVAALLLVGVVARSCIKPLRWLYIPSSVIAGFIGLAVVQLAPGTLAGPFAEIAGTLKEWPSFLIAVVFAGMLLERKPSGTSNTLSRVGRQGLMVWIIVLGETTVGLIATWLLIKPFFDIPNSFGMLIETGFAGGHGTAGAMADVFAHPAINFPAGGDLGMLMATGGLVYGIISGLLWINLGVRRGWVSKTITEQTSTTLDNQPISIGTARIGGEIIDPLLLQLVWLALAFGVGLALHSGVGWVGDALSPEIVVSETITQLDVPATIDPANPDEAIADVAKAEQRATEQLGKRLSWANLLGGFPLFIFTLAGGLIVRWLLRLVGQADKIDTASINRLGSAAMDVLVVAAITTLNISAVSELATALVILFITGCLWAGFCLLVVARWVLPKEHWFQLGLINYGMSTGTTATGFVLLRVVDPELESGAAEDYALAAPLSAPFIGGGMITIALPLLILEQIPLWIPTLILAAIIATLIAIGKRWNR